MIGMCKKAGKLKSGGDTCLKEIRAGKATMIIVAEDASQNTKKRFMDACKNKKIEIIEFGTGEMLGKMAGKDYRTIIGIMDENFKKAILSKMNKKLTGVSE